MTFVINNPSFLQSAGNAGSAGSANDYFYITSRADNNVLGFDIGPIGGFSGNLVYSINSVENWEQLTADKSIILGVQDTIYFKNNTGAIADYTGDVLLRISEEFDCGGDIMKLFYPGVSVVPSNCFKRLFKGLHIVSAKDLKLPAITLNEACYASMFENCDSLTEAPELPATTLAKGCYASMFSNCSRLTKAPELPAITLAEACYISMFSNCTSLITAPKLPATTLANSCYVGMFYGCSNLKEAPELPAITLAEVCYNSMFSNCTSLIKAPELPATTLAEGCYSNMFEGCTSLTEIKCLGNPNGGESYTSNWVVGVADSGEFTKSSESVWRSGDSGIPLSWTVIQSMLDSVGEVERS